MRSLSRWSHYVFVVAVLAFVNPVDAARKHAAPAPESDPAAATEAAAPEPAHQPAGASEEFRNAATQLDSTMRAWMAKSGPVRADGYVYGMDVAPLMLYAAQRHDAALYNGLMPYAQRLIATANDDPNADAFVLWRHKDGQKAEVSGTSEALWMARALWAGSQNLGRSDDRSLAVKVLVGYGRHARVKQGTWRVSKYYAFSSRTFSDLSVLADYAPDFLAEVEPYAHGAADMAQRSYALLRGAVGPSHLLAPVVHPEITADFPHVQLAAYGPNNIASLADSCTAAENSLRGSPALARGVMEFVGTPPERRDDNGRLFAYFDRTSGLAVGDTALGGPGYACLARLSVALNDGGHLEEFEPVLITEIKALAEATPQSVAAPLYAAGPLLLTAQAMGVFAQGK